MLIETKQVEILLYTKSSGQRYEGKTVAGKHDTSSYTKLKKYTSAVTIYRWITTDILASHKTTTFKSPLYKCDARVDSSHINTSESKINEVYA